MWFFRAIGKLVSVRKMLVYMGKARFGRAGVAGGIPLGKYTHCHTVRYAIKSHTFLHLTCKSLAAALSGFIVA
jgi:hypothetical protein